MKNITLKELIEITKLNKELCYDLIYDGFFILEQNGGWCVISNNSHDGWKTTIPTYYIE